MLRYGYVKKKFCCRNSGCENAQNLLENFQGNVIPKVFRSFKNAQVAASHLSWVKDLPLSLPCIQ